MENKAKAPAKKTKVSVEKPTNKVASKPDVVIEQPVTEPVKVEVKVEEKVEPVVEPVKVEEKVEPVVEQVKVEEKVEPVVETVKVEEKVEPVVETVKVEEKVEPVVETVKVEPVVVAPIVVTPTVNEEPKPVTETKETPVKPVKVEKQKRTGVEKFALFLIIIGFIAMAVGYIPIVSALFLALYYVILMALMILTLFTLLLNENFKQWLNGGAVISNVISSILPYCVYAFGGATGLFVISLIMYCFAKKKARKIAGIALNILFAILSVVGIVLLNVIGS